jgi:AcrR family transcriptional regulator
MLAGTMTTKKPKEQRVNDIIDAAVDELLEKGYESATMESIAVRAGLTKGGLYHHFGSKDEILLAANERFSQPVYQMLAELEQDNDPAEALATYIRDYLHHWASRPRELQFFILAFSKLLEKPDLWSGYSQYYNHLLGRIAAKYESGIKQGIFDSLEPHDQAMTYVSALDGAAVLCIILEGLSEEDISRQLINVLINEMLI